MPEELQGKALEYLVSTLEKALVDTPNVTVHSPMRLPDRTTGRMREHDVVLELKEGHHSLLIAIECRDRSRPIGVPQVEAFGAKCLDTGISQGIIVSTMGFYNTAKTKADHLDIRCLDIEEVENFEWLLAPGVYATTTRLLRNDWTFYPMKDGVVKPDGFQVIDKDGNLASMAALTANAQRQLTKILSNIPETVEEEEVTIKFPGDGLFLKDIATDDTVPVNFAIAKLRYTTEQELVPFRLVQYQAANNDEHIADVAYADMKFGEKEARFMIVYKDGQGGKVVLIPKRKNS